MNDVYSAKTDLINKDEFKRVQKHPKLLFFILLAVVAFLIFITIISSGNANNKKILEYYTLKSSDEKLGGIVGVRTYKNNKVEAIYHITIHDKLPDNFKCYPNQPNCVFSVTYTYAGNLVTPWDKSDNSEGSLSTHLCGKDKMPQGDEVFEFSFKPWERQQCLKPTDQTPRNLEYFYTNFTQVFESVDQMKKANIFNVHDSQNFWEVTDKDSNGIPIGAKNNTDRAVAETKPIKTYSIEYVLK